MSQPTVIVGITREQPDSVIAQALVFAKTFHARLLCVYVDVSRYVVSTQTGGIVHAAPYDPDSSGPVDESVPGELRERILRLAAPSQTTCDFLATAGDATAALAKAAETAEALMIVVGTRKMTFGGSVHQFFQGSVAANLAHRQHRPVIVIPLDPVGGDTPLLWDEEPQA